MVVVLMEKEPLAGYLKGSAAYVLNTESCKMNTCIRTEYTGLREYE